MFRNVKYDAFESKLVDRGVGGPPYVSSTTADPYVILPKDGGAIPTVLAQGNPAWTAATIPRGAAQRTIRMITPRQLLAAAV